MASPPNFATLPGATYNALRGRTIRYDIFPAMIGNATNVSGGVIMAAGAAGYGARSDIVPVVAGIATDFWICSFQYNSFAPGAGRYDICIEDATPTQLFQVKLDLAAATVNVSPFILPFPIWMVANAQVQGRAGHSGAGGNIYVAITYATLL